MLRWFYWHWLFSGFSANHRSGCGCGGCDPLDSPSCAPPTYCLHLPPALLPGDFQRHQTSGVHKWVSATGSKWVHTRVSEKLLRWTPLLSRSSESSFLAPVFLSAGPVDYSSLQSRRPLPKGLWRPSGSALRLFEKRAIVCWWDKQWPL